MNGSDHACPACGYVHVHPNIEVKDCSRQDLPTWTAEAQLEAGNDDALAGIVIAKRRGTRDVSRYWVHMTVAELVALLTGERQPQ